MPWGLEEEWRPPARYSGERPDHDSEARRLAALTREAQTRRETIERQARARMAGFRPIDEVIEWADAARGGHSNGYPEEWAELASLARKLAPPGSKSARLPDGS